MAGNIFINYRREESGHVAGRLHDSLAPTFGRDKLFMDVDNIPVGRDFEDYLKSQVAACDAMLAIIGPNWLTAKDETGQRRLDNPEDFVVIEIGAALARNIPVVPVLVDGARMPKASELPDSLKHLARRQAIQVRHTNFRSDAEALTKKMRAALGDRKSTRDWWRLERRDLLIVAVIVVVGALTWFGLNVLSRPDPPNTNDPVISEIANLSETIRRDPKNAIAFVRRGNAFAKKGDFVRALTDYNEAIRLDPKNADAFFSRGVFYAKNGDLNRAITDYSEVIRTRSQERPRLCEPGR